MKKNKLPDESEAYIETVTSIARATGVLGPTVRLYGNLGLLDYITLPNGMRLHKPSSIARVREIYAERIARRGGYVRAGRGNGT